MANTLLIERLAQLEWKPTSSGGVAIGKSKWEAAIEDLSEAERREAQALVFAHGSSTVGEGEHNSAYFAGVEGRFQRSGEHVGHYALEGGLYAPHCMMAPNALTTAIREQNHDFKTEYEKRIGTNSYNECVEDLVRETSQLSGWKKQEGESCFSISQDALTDQVYFRSKEWCFLMPNCEETGDNRLIASEGLTKAIERSRKLQAIENEEQAIEHAQGLHTISEDAAHMKATVLDWRTSAVKEKREGLG